MILRICTPTDDSPLTDLNLAKKGRVTVFWPWVLGQRWLTASPFSAHPQTNSTSPSSSGYLAGGKKEMQPTSHQEEPRPHNPTSFFSPYPISRSSSGDGCNIQSRATAKDQHHQQQHFKRGSQASRVSIHPHLSKGEGWGERTVCCWGGRGEEPHHRDAGRTVLCARREPDPGKFLRHLSVADTHSTLQSHNGPNL